MTSFRRRLTFATAIALSALALAGCRGPAVPMEPAPLANAPECAEVTVRLPETVDDLELRSTNAQATGAWGTPASILLHCGVPTPGPTTDRCISLDGVDWVEDDSRAPTYVYTTYGRTPAVQVTIDASNGTVSGTNALMDLNDVVQQLPLVGACVGADDLLDVPTAAPTKAPDEAPTPAPPE